MKVLQQTFFLGWTAPIQIAKTTHFRDRGDGWFRACREASKALAAAENSAAM